MISQLVVVSNNSISREGLARIVSVEDFDVLDTASSVDEVDWDLCREKLIVLIDLGLHDDAIEIIETVKSQCKLARCVLLSETFDLETIIGCFEKDAQGFLMKDIDCSPMLAALKLAALGEKVIPSGFVSALSPAKRVSFASNANDIEKANLSHREMDVLCCLMAGYSNKVIARHLVLSEATVKVHVKAILRKLKVGNRTQAALWGSAHSLTPLSHQNYQPAHS